LYPQAALVDNYLLVKIESLIHAASSVQPRLGGGLLLKMHTQQEGLTYKVQEKSSQIVVILRIEAKLNDEDESAVHEHLAKHLLQNPELNLESGTDPMPNLSNRVFGL
jgi:hypothetical protein